MKTILNGIIVVVCVICMDGCKKENVTTPNVSASEKSLSTTTKVGRQQVIQIKTGDYYYPTSKALLWLPKTYNPNLPMGIRC